MLRHEGAGTLDDPEYLDAVAKLYARHVYRTSPYDGASLAGWAQENRRAVFPSDGSRVRTLGSARVYGARDRRPIRHHGPAAEIAVPALIVCGWFDELTPAADAVARS